MNSTSGTDRRFPVRLATQIALGARMLSLDGHDDFNQGQISARMPRADTFYIKNARCGFDEATPGQVVAASIWPDDPVDPLAPPELPLHQAVYRTRPDVNGIVHSHAPHTLVFGATELSLRPISHEGAHFVDRLGLFTDTSNTVLDQETGENIAKTLGDGVGVLLRNHGGVIVGKSVRHAAVFGQVLERACRLQLLAEQSGRSYAWSTATDVQLKRDFIYADLSVRSYWDYAARRVVRVWPEAAQWGHG
ncbi:class II aldolase/adducin family protein [Streptomyces sp. DT24]|uniref:class II aldolase/adducin family protein n=1 Tax=Streptomyces sp. DT24 TaxID=3416520 RepID=UPI003CF3B7B1